MERKIKFSAHGQRWFDRVNGNTYHSVSITRLKDGETIKCPMTYGYDDHYRQTALEAMVKAKWLPAKYRSPANTYLYERENNYPIVWSVSDGTKKAMIDNGE